MNNAILNFATGRTNIMQTQPTTNNEDACWQAVMARDGTTDGQFVFAVSSTGVYCRPSCPSRRPRRENVRFFRHPHEAENAGYRACLRCRPRAPRGNPRQELVKSVCRFIEQHLDEPITLAQLGKEFSQSPFHLQRTFKTALGISPKQYADSCRMRGFRLKLKSGQSVTRAMHEAGYSSTSRLYERTTSELGMEPSRYRRGAIAAIIRYTCVDSPLGRMLIATTGKGVCSIQFADNDEELEQGLKQEFPFASRRRDDKTLAPTVELLMHHMLGQEATPALPLDIQATAFQRRVWTYLQTIPFGETRSYSDIAKGVKQASAVRAVARACANNPVAVAIPCHRVVRSSGDLGGYRWGMQRKKTLLEIEAGKQGDCCHNGKDYLPFLHRS